MSSNRASFYSTRVPPFRPARRKAGTLLFSFVAAVVVHAAGAAFFLLHSDSAPQVRLLLQTGEEAVQLEIGHAATVAPSPAVREIPERSAEAEQERSSVIEKEALVAELPRTAAGIFSPFPEEAQQRMDIPADMARAEKPVRNARRKAEGEPSNQPETAQQERLVATGSAAMIEGAAARPRGVRQRPVPVEALLPQYPDSSRRLGEEGEVLIRAVIDAHGKCRNAVIEHSSGFPALDRAALDTVLRANYRPATEDGLATAVEDRFVIAFQLR